MNGGIKITRSVKTLWLVVLLLRPGAGIQAAGLREFQDSWLISGDESGALLSQKIDSLELIIHPGTTMGLDLGQARLFSLPELEQTNLRAIIQATFLGRRLLLEGDWQQLGTGIFQEDKTWVTVRLGSRPAIGLKISRNRIRLAGEEVAQRIRVKLDLDYLVRMETETILRCRAVLPLDSPESTLDHDSRQDLLTITLLRSRTALAMGLDRRFEGTPVVGFDFFWVLGGGVGFSLRVDPVTSSLGPGIHIRRGPLLLRTSHLVHPDLGQTHRFSISLKRAHG